MTLMMYAVKSGASGVGNVDTATKITEYLIDQGADLSARSVSDLSARSFSDLSARSVSDLSARSVSDLSARSVSDLSAR